MVSDAANLRMTSIIFIASVTGRSLHASNFLKSLSNCSLSKSWARSPSISKILFLTTSKVSTYTPYKGSFRFLVFYLMVPLLRDVEHLKNPWQDDDFLDWTKQYFIDDGKKDINVRLWPEMLQDRDSAMMNKQYSYRQIHLESQRKCTKVERLAIVVSIPKIIRTMFNFKCRLKCSLCVLVLGRNIRRDLFCEVPEQIKMVCLKATLNCEVFQDLLDLHCRIPD